MTENASEPPTAPPADSNTAEILKSALGYNACYLMDVIDGKVSALISYIGILIAAVLIFATREHGYEFAAQRPLIQASLAAAIMAALFALSCLYTINNDGREKRLASLDKTIRSLDRAARSRLRRYLTALILSVISTILTAAAVIPSL